MLKYKINTKKISQLNIFIVSIVISVITLFLERLVGIGWDYHPDAVTYMNQYDEIFDLVSEDPLKIFNNFNYIIIWLCEKISINLIFINIIMFSYANTIIAKLHYKYHGQVRNINILLVLLLANPYRIHLSTTLLKDTAIILILLLLIGNRRSILLYFIALSYRIASLIYFPLYLSAKNFSYLLFALFLLSIPFYQDIYILIMNQNTAIMQFRDFDRIPNFTDLGLLGVLFRILLWPLIAITGTFFIIAPSIEYLLVSTGVIMGLIYIYLSVDISKSYHKIAMGFMLCSFFALATTGFNSFIRYVYPIIVILPLMLKNEEYNLKS